MGSKSRQPAARIGDIDTGHPPAPPTPVITGSTNVLVNFRPAARKGDMLAPHHPGVRIITEGSGSVNINGKPAARVTDAINCGGKLIIGSGNVFIGDNPPSGNALAPGEWDATIAAVNKAKNPGGYQEQQMRADIAVKYRGQAAGVASWNAYYSDTVIPKPRPAPASVKDPVELEGLQQAINATPPPAPKIPAPLQQQTIDQAGQQMQQAIQKLPEGEMVTPEMLNLANTMLQGGSKSNSKVVESSASINSSNQSSVGDTTGFIPQGINADPKDSMQGRLLMQQFRQQHPDMSPVEIQRLARSTLETGADLPVVSIAKPGDKFYKLIPTNETRGPSAGTVYWMDGSQLNDLMSNQINIGSSFGLPNKTTASTYNVFEVTVKEGQAPLVFRSDIAPVVDDGIYKPGGQNQTVIPKRSAFRKPSKLLDEKGSPLVIKSR